MAGETDGKSLLMGRIGAAHGIRGEVRITPFTEDPLALTGYGPLATDRPGLTITIAAARLQKNVIIARLKGFADRTAVEALNGVSLFVAREQLPPTDDDDFYHADLVGLDARLEDGPSIGKVIAVPNFGAGDLIEIGGSDGETFLFPFTKAVVPHIHLKDGYLIIAPPFDAEPGEEEPD
ncbi:MAG: RimM [Devosia sp.]|nr:RimM [Devosia sp.]